MNYILTYSLVIVEMLSGQLPRVESTLRPVDLRCEYLKSPLGIDRTSPRLSWKLQAALHGKRGLRQTSFQILVAATVDSLGAGKGDLWDSGRVVSDESTNVIYAGRPLESRQQCWWKVRIWDQDGQLSEWSEPSMWSMGLLHVNDWLAQWIGLDGEDQTQPEDPARTRLVLPAGEVLHHANRVRVAASIVVDGPQPAFELCIAEKVSGDPVEQLSQAAPLIPGVPSMKGGGGFKKTRTALPQLFLN